MSSLLLVVFILQLVLHIINTVGASKINDIVGLLSAVACVMFE
jgi:tail-anchored protein insertion receptor